MELFDWLEEEGKGELEISSHFLSVGGKQIKAVRLSTGGFELDFGSMLGQHGDQG